MIPNLGRLVFESDPFAEALDSIPGAAIAWSGVVA